MCSTEKKPDDIVITLAIRTPLAKGFKGGLKDTGLDYLVYALLKQVVERSGIDPSVVEDICLGNVRHFLLSTPRGSLWSLWLIWDLLWLRSMMARQLILSARRCWLRDFRTRRQLQR